MSMAAVFSAIRPTSAPNAAEPLDALRRRAAAAAATAAAAAAALWLQPERRCNAELQHGAWDTFTRTRARHPRCTVLILPNCKVFF